MSWYIALHGLHPCKPDFILLLRLNKSIKTNILISLSVEDIKATADKDNALFCLKWLVKFDASPFMILLFCISQLQFCTLLHSARLNCKNGTFRL